MGEVWWQEKRKSTHTTHKIRIGSKFSLKEPTVRSSESPGKHPAKDFPFKSEARSKNQNQKLSQKHTSEEECM